MKMYSKKIGILFMALGVGVMTISLVGCNTQKSSKEEVNVALIENKLISVEEATAMSKRFVNDVSITQKLAAASDSLNTRPQFKLAASSHYTLEEIEAYIQYAKLKSEEKGYSVDGLTFYFGVYPKGGEKEGYLTMFIAPTGEPGVQKGGFGFYYGEGDVPDVPPLNAGGLGDPPTATYPQ